MTTQATNYGSVVEQIEGVIQSSTEAEEAVKYNYMVTIAILTWLLLSCISVFIYCCNYWEFLQSPKNRASSQQEQEVDQSDLELEQQSMLLTQVSC